MPIPPETVDLTLTPEEANQLRMLVATAWGIHDPEQAQVVASRLNLKGPAELRTWCNDMIIKITQTLAKLPLEGT